LLVKHLLGEASAAEQKAVEEWLKKDAANTLYYNQLQQIWDSSKALAATSAVDTNKAWEKFQQRTQSGSATTDKKRIRPFLFYKIAASILIVVGLALVANYLFRNSRTVREITADAKTNILTETLPDGSVITLNKQSSVTYPEKFKGRTRPVTLKGEAFFNVSPDKAKPFVIAVNDIQVMVVGTSFNIKSSTDKTEVLVETGVVRVTRNGATVELNAGEKIVFSPKDTTPVKEPVTDKLYNYYRSKEFVCDNTPLWKLVEVLNEAYNARITIGRKELAGLRLDATFNNESLDKILEIIHLTFDIRVTRQDDQIILN
jgi:ferric-dicitrate binding protein FerR (iron transport regulator)